LIKNNPNILLDKIRDEDIQGKPYKKFDITNSIIKNKKGVMITILNVLLKYLYSRKIIAKKKDKKNGNKIDRNTYGVVFSLTKNGFLIHDI
tara:strand:- start:450 stop:722 length:273 start_codon:yes stop_codon:yes gene_type:complete